MLYTTSLVRCESCDETFTEDRCCVDEFGGRNCPNGHSNVTHIRPRNARWVSVAAYVVVEKHGGSDNDVWRHSYELLIADSVRTFNFGDWAKHSPDNEKDVEAYKETLNLRYSRQARHITIRVRSEGLPPKCISVLPN